VGRSAGKHSYQLAAGGTGNLALNPARQQVAIDQAFTVTASCSGFTPGVDYFGAVE